jgi:hypothetical protein
VTDLFGTPRVIHLAKEVVPMRTVLKSPVVPVMFISLFLNIMIIQALPDPAAASFITREWMKMAESDNAKEKELQVPPKQEGKDKVELTEKVPDSSVRVQNVQMATHLAGSHLGLVTRPVSFIYRLAFMVLHTGVDAVKWTWRIGLDGKPVPRVSDRPGMDLDIWESELDRITGSVSSTGTMKYLIDGWEYFPRLEETLARAEESIDIRTYIFDNDDYALKIAELIKTRSRETEVRVLLDGLGTILATKADPDSIPHEHDAPSSMRKFLETGSRVKVRQQLNPFFTFDHTKTTIIDHKLAYIGGMNIGREYRYDWHDLMVELQGPVVTSSGVIWGSWPVHLRPEKRSLMQPAFPSVCSIPGPMTPRSTMLNWRPYAGQKDSYTFRTLISRMTLFCMNWRGPGGVVWTFGSFCRQRATGAP